MPYNSRIGHYRNVCIIIIIIIIINIIIINIIIIIIIIINPLGTESYSWPSALSFNLTCLHGK